MEIEYCTDVVKPCNLTRKRQAVLESRTDHRTNVGLNLLFFCTCFNNGFNVLSFFLCSFFVDLGCK